GAIAAPAQHAQQRRQLEASRRGCERCFAESFIDDCDVAIALLDRYERFHCQLLEVPSPHPGAKGTFRPRPFRQRGGGYLASMRRSERAWRPSRRAAPESVPASSTAWVRNSQIARSRLRGGCEPSRSAATSGASPGAGEPAAPSTRSPAAGVTKQP